MIRKESQKHASDNSRFSIDSYNRKETTVRPGRVTTAFTVGDVMYVICILSDGTIAGRIDNVPDTTVPETMIACDKSFRSMGMTEHDVIGLVIDITFAGKTPLYASVRTSVSGGSEQVLSPFGIPRSEIILARNISKDHTLNADARKYLKEKGYSDDQIDAVFDAKLSKIDYNGKVLTTGKVGWQVTHEADLKNTVLLPDNVIENIAAAKLLDAPKKRQCWVPLFIGGR